MSWEHTLRLRCPNDTDPAPSARAGHVALNIRLPLWVEALAPLATDLPPCACGTNLVVCADPEDPR